MKKRREESIRSGLNISECHRSLILIYQMCRPVLIDVFQRIKDRLYMWNELQLVDAHTHIRFYRMKYVGA